MSESIKLIRNTTEQDMMVIVEPWGVDYTLPAGSIFEVVARSEQEGELELENRPGYVLVWAWPGCTYAVYQDGVLIEDIPIAVPSVPAGMTTRSFLGMIFGEGGT